MSIWYSFLDMFPFEWTNYVFMKNAFLAILLVTPVFGLLGTMIVNNKMSFFSDALGHSALTGVGIGVALGASNVDIIMVLFSILFAIGIVLIKHKQKTSMDTTIGVFSATAVALGVVLLSKGGFNKFSNILVGDILSITPKEIAMISALLIVVIVVWRLMYNTLLVVSLGPTLATSRGINICLTDIVFTSLIAIVVTFSIKWVGILIINSLFILPASAARIIAKNMREYTIISISIAMISGVLGLLTSYYFNISAGATIAIYCAGFYAIIFLFIKH